MIDLSNISFLGSWVLDVVLILISASACFYCALLSRRLKALNGLEDGVGASIVSLTEAIGKTHDAAREAQGATHETVETLRFLLKKCESMAPNIEASLTELEGELKIARRLKTELSGTVTPELKAATQRARLTAQGLLKTLELVQAHQSAKAASKPAAPVKASSRPAKDAANSEPSFVTVRPFKKAAQAHVVSEGNNTTVTSAPALSFASNLTVLKPPAVKLAKAVNS